MTIILEQAERPFQRSFAGGEGGLGEIWTASREALLLVENSNAAFEALSRAYEARSRISGASARSTPPI